MPVIVSSCKKYGGPMIFVSQSFKGFKNVFDAQPSALLLGAAFASGCLAHPLRHMHAVLEDL
jgi:hypothetical protein